MNFEKPEIPAEKVRATQIIVIAQALGLAGFAAFAISMADRAKLLDFGWPLDVVSLVMLATAMSIPLAFIVPKAIRMPRHLQEQSTMDGLLGLYQTRTIIYCALLEGAGFANAVALLMEPHVANLTVVGVVLVLLLLAFPTIGRVEQWIAAEVDDFEARM